MIGYLKDTTVGRALVLHVVDLVRLLVPLILARSRPSTSPGMTPKQNNQKTDLIWIQFYFPYNLIVLVNIVNAFL